MRTKILVCGLTLAALLSAGCAPSVKKPTAVASATAQGKTYYAVKADAPAMNSGDKVCAAHNLPCIGYTAINTTSICQQFHPTAKTVTSVNGSKAGFYCDGAPQTGPACDTFKNTCEVCPACNTNMDCATDLTGLNQVREAYIECGTGSGTSTSSASMQTSLPTMSLPAHQQPVMQLPGTNTGTAAEVSCTFSQKTKKLVTCGAYQAANTFCVLQMQSTSAHAVQCQDNDNVVCVLPCSAKGSENLKQCAFGGVMAGKCY